MVGFQVGSIKPANTKKTCLHLLKHLSFLHFILLSRLYSPHQLILNPETSPSYIKCTNGQIVDPRSPSKSFPEADSELVIYYTNGTFSDYPIGHHIFKKNGPFSRFNVYHVSVTHLGFAFECGKKNKTTQNVQKQDDNGRGYLSNISYTLIFSVETTSGARLTASIAKPKISDSSGYNTVLFCSLCESNLEQMEDTAHAQFHILYLLVPWCVQGPGMATGNSYSRNNRAFFHEGKYTEHEGI